MRRALAPLLLGVGASVAACGYFQGDVGPYRTPAYYEPAQAATGAGPVDQGRQLYLRDCAHCHGADGKGTERGPDLTVGTNGPALTDFVLRTGRMPVEEPPEQMRAREPVYAEGQIAAIVEYVKNEFQPPGPEIPHIDPGHGDLAEGQQVYAEHCAACHATTGIGGALLVHPRQGESKTRGIVIPDFEHSDALAVAEAVRTGPGSMPVFGPRAISDEQLNALVAYTEYLKDPVDEGGAPIGRVGPVVEGAVGWLVGLGVLMLFIRWVGTKAGEQP
ncbi:MAG TPA: c-type cytochrome [Acidimicrobiales bacterium]|nr:c-type cytochrome [Acidimicrobiales bacterium]